MYVTFGTKNFNLGLFAKEFADACHSGVREARYCRDSSKVAKPSRVGESAGRLPQGYPWGEGVLLATPHPLGTGPRVGKLRVCH